MKTNLIRDTSKINAILDLIINDQKNIKTSRIDMFYINIYYQVSELETIYFKVFNPSTFGNEFLIKERIENNEITN